jgi:hypothetical protein
MDWPEQLFPGNVGAGLPQNSLFLPATLAASPRDQLPLFHVEFPFGHDFPPMKAAPAQRLAFGFCLRGRFPEFNDLAHAPQMVPEKPGVHFGW